ncbi:MAG: FecR domain-containing protein, partial [Chitinophagaceae bacterium]|nr:FecR domain-containing protein [Chitinophagaceae bacterium]
MENEFEILMDIRSKLEAGESLTQSEQTLWEEWTCKPYVRDDKFVDEDSFEELLEIYAQKKPFDEYWEELEKRMIKQQRSRFKIPKLRRLRGIGKIHANIMEFRKIAVAIIIITGIIVTTWPVFQSNDKEKERPSVDMGYHVIKVPPRSNQELTLPDGSYVSLNAGSTLRYPDTFSCDNRVVELDGEAYFDIKHLDDNIPFYVITKEQEIKVTGTKFNIDDYDNNNFKKTTLLEGSV